MSAKLSMRQIRWRLLNNGTRKSVLDRRTWRTPNECAALLGVGNGIERYRVALVLERLANDGLAELERPGATQRRFRKAPKVP